MVVGTTTTTIIGGKLLSTSLLSNIFEFLPILDLSIASNVNRTWRTLILESLANNPEIHEFLLRLRDYAVFALTILPITDNKDRELIQNETAFWDPSLSTEQRLEMLLGKLPSFATFLGKRSYLKSTIHHDEEDVDGATTDFASSLPKKQFFILEQYPLRLCQADILHLLSDVLTQEVELLSERERVLRERVRHVRGGGAGGSRSEPSAKESAFEYSASKLIEKLETLNESKKTLIQPNKLLRDFVTACLLVSYRQSDEYTCCSVGALALPHAQLAFRSHLSEPNCKLATLRLQGDKFAKFDSFIAFTKALAANTSLKNVELTGDWRVSRMNRLLYALRSHPSLENFFFSGQLVDQHISAFYVYVDDDTDTPRLQDFGFCPPSLISIMIHAANIESKDRTQFFDPTLCLLNCTSNLKRLVLDGVPITRSVVSFLQRNRSLESLTITVSMKMACESDDLWRAFAAALSQQSSSSGTSSIKHLFVKFNMLNNNMGFEARRMLTQQDLSHRMRTLFLGADEEQKEGGIQGMRSLSSLEILFCDKLAVRRAVITVTKALCEFLARRGRQTSGSGSLEQLTFGTTMSLIASTRRGLLVGSINVDHIFDNDDDDHTSNDDNDENDEDEVFSEFVLEYTKKKKKTSEIPATTPQQHVKRRGTEQGSMRNVDDSLAIAAAMLARCFTSQECGEQTVLMKPSVAITTTKTLLPADSHNAPYLYAFARGGKEALVKAIIADKFPQASPDASIPCDGRLKQLTGSNSKDFISYDELIEIIWNNIYIRQIMHDRNTATAGAGTGAGAGAGGAPTKSALTVPTTGPHGTPKNLRFLGMSNNAISQFFVQLSPETKFESIAIQDMYNYTSQSRSQGRIIAFMPFHSAMCEYLAQSPLLDEISFVSGNDNSDFIVLSKALKSNTTLKRLRIDKWHNPALHVIASLLSSVNQNKSSALESIDINSNNKSSPLFFYNRTAFQQQQQQQQQGLTNGAGLPNIKSIIEYLRGIRTEEDPDLTAAATTRSNDDNDNDIFAHDDDSSGSNASTSLFGCASTTTTAATATAAAANTDTDTAPGGDFRLFGGSDNPRGYPMMMGHMRSCSVRGGFSIGSLFGHGRGGSGSGNAGGCLFGSNTSASTGSGSGEKNITKPIVLGPAKWPPQPQFGDLERISNEHLRIHWQRWIYNRSNDNWPYEDDACNNLNNKGLLPVLARLRAGDFDTESLLHSAFRVQHTLHRFAGTSRDINNNDDGSDDE